MDVFEMDASAKLSVRYLHYVCVLFVALGIRLHWEYSQV